MKLYHISISPTLYFKMLFVSGLVLIWNFFQETCFHHLHVYLLAWLYEIHLKFLLSHIYFDLDDSKLCKQYQSVSEEMMGADMRFRKSWAARNTSQGIYNVLYRKFVIEVVEKKSKFSCNCLIYPNLRFRLVNGGRAIQFVILMWEWS